MKEILLEPVDRVDVTIVVDNFIDGTLEGSTGVNRPKDRKVDEPLLAEHGLSVFLKIVNSRFVYFIKHGLPIKIFFYNMP